MRTPAASNSKVVGSKAAKRATRAADPQPAAGTVVACPRAKLRAREDGMATTFDLSTSLVGLHRDGTARPLTWESGPPPRVDGFTIGCAEISRPAPHGGELHPDADEVLLLVSGRVDVILDEAGRERVVEVRAGQGFVVPRGVWHRVVPREPSRLVHVTPGPRGEWRPLPR
jgi:mannose-6-phosphate isomerase-like protein (cupin superfamily)